MPGNLSRAGVIVDDPAEASTLHNRGWFGKPRQGGGLDLTMLEAVFLAEAGRLEVRRDGYPVTVRELFRRATASVDRFEIRYLVYRDLRLRGYVLDERDGFVEFHVYPRGGAPGKTPSKYWIAARSERAVFDLDEILVHAKGASAVRKALVIAVVDEESDLTYYAVHEAEPKGHRPNPTIDRPIVVHFLGDRAMVVDEEEAQALHAAGFFGKIVGRRLQLSLLETVYLLKNCLVEVRNAETDRPIGLARLLREAASFQRDFALRLRAYEDLMARGIIPKTGFKFGCHFRAYEGDPEIHHAKYLVHALPRGHQGMWPEISRAVRLAHGVKKQILFGEVGPRVRYVRLERVRP